MARTRAQRRHNTHVKATARKAAGQHYCSNKITPNGEACSCSLCVTSNNNEQTYYEAFRTTQLSELLKSFDE